ncbi:MAG: PepSY-associated TM helix domain-containing protein [Methylococcales bacterium]|nr:PepSY-associated TM helix domain-containing protein [Methylococcales bacterium]
MKKNSHSFWRLLYKAHRYMGLISALVLLVLAITGIALNHTDTLKLDSRYTHNPYLLTWYGILSPNATRVFKTSQHYISQFDKQLYLNKSVISNTTEVLQGAIETHDFIVIALENSLILLSLDGAIIEHIEQPRLEKIGINTQQHIFIKQLKTILVSDDGLLSWKSASTTQIQWSQTAKLPESIETVIKQEFRGTILPLERIFLDLHSGRFFGKIGVFIVDACGILLILLIFSGLSIWLKHALKKLLPPYK